MKKLTKPLISIIVPVYNVEAYVEKCALSLINQTYENCEFIFINDGTKDNSILIIENIKDSRIKIINQKNMGVSIARNKGLELSKGDYVMFIDADDYAGRDYVEYLYNLISENDADYAYSTKLFKFKNDKQTDNESIEIVDSNKSTGLLLSPDVVVGSCNKIYKKAVIDKNNLRFRNDLFYGEGLNFIVRMSLCSKKIVVGNRKVLYYRKNNINSATTKYNNEKYHNGLKSLKIIRDMVDLEDEFVYSMYQIHMSTFYLNAVTQMIENKKINKYVDDYKSWNKNIRSSLGFILKSKYISIYRKCMILVGAISPHLVAIINKRRRKRIINQSVD